MFQNHIYEISLVAIQLKAQMNGKEQLVMVRLGCSTEKERTNGIFFFLQLREAYFSFTVEIISTEILHSSCKTFSESPA